MAALGTLSKNRRFKQGRMPSVACAAGHVSSMPTEVLNTGLERSRSAGASTGTEPRSSTLATPQHRASERCCPDDRKTDPRPQEADLRVEASMTCPHCHIAIIFVAHWTCRGSLGWNFQQTWGNVSRGQRWRPSERCREPRWLSGRIAHNVNDSQLARSPTQPSGDRQERSPVLSDSTLGYAAAPQFLAADAAAASEENGPSKTTHRSGLSDG